jgi:predicted DNA binding CopG/RHH family protein
VLRLDAPRRVADEGGWHTHINNDGVAVRYDSGRTEVLPTRRIIKPWAVHAAELAKSLENDRRIEEAQKQAQERADRVIAALAAAGFHAAQNEGRIEIRIETAEALLAAVKKEGSL